MPQALRHKSFMPASPDDLFATLDHLGIAHATVSHPPLFTVEQSRALRGQIQQVFERAGMGPLGEQMLGEIAREVGGAQAEQEAAAQSGDAAATLAAVLRAADRVPNVQFLVNASNAVFTLLDAQGWKPEQAEHGLRYLLKAQAKDPKNPRVLAAYDLFQHVAHKYGVSVSAFRQQVLDSRQA